VQHVADGDDVGMGQPLVVDPKPFEVAARRVVVEGELFAHRALTLV
jgi:hypothetical protein